MLLFLLFVSCSLWQSSFAEIGSSFTPFPESGFYTVNATFGVNLFYVLNRPTQSNCSSCPLVLWLDGGPGAASTWGMMFMNGPYFVQKDLTLISNPHAWNDRVNMLYFDQPAGVGWSYVQDASGYVHSTEESSAQLYDALTQFFKEYPEFTKVDFYISGGSYGGKWVTGISHKILAEKAFPNFKGIIIEDGWVDPETQIQGYAAVGYVGGMFDDGQEGEIRQSQDLCVEAIQSREWIKARQIWSRLIENFANFSGGVNMYDIRKHHPFVDYVQQFMDQSWVRKMFHVPEGVQYVCDSAVVFENFAADFLQSLLSCLIEVLDSERNLDVLMYVGQFDYIVNYLTTSAMLRGMDWHGQKPFNDRHAQVWKIDGEVAGTTKEFDNLRFNVVYDAGHLAARDQGENVREMVEDFIFRF